MYDVLIRRRSQLAALQGDGKDRLLEHRGDDLEFIRRHERHAAEVANENGQVRPMLPLLFRRIADSRTMHVACRDLRDGGGAPGRNGLRIDQLSDRETWSLSRALASSVLECRHRPGARRKVRIPKSNGGVRQLQISNIQDRIVDRGVLRIIQPVLDPQFSSFSFGFRPGLGPMNALAAGLALAESRGQWCWAMADIANAFDAIPRNRLLCSFAIYLPCDVVELVSRITEHEGIDGLPQGSPIAPLLANLYFHHFLDRSWHRRHPDVPLLRYVDDLAVMADSVKQAASLHDCIKRLARSCGTPIKETAVSPVADLASGQTVQWLGFRIGLEAGKPVLRLTEKAWDGLLEGFTQANLSPCSPLRAQAVVRGWIDQIGPCYEAEDRGAVAARIVEAGVQHGFSELPLVDDLVGFWQRSHARWAKLRQMEVQRLAGRIGNVFRAVPGFTVMREPRQRAPGRSTRTAGNDRT
jgi:RNA-directed DNA polymerase